ncbi:MAG: 4Fe-4S binding protein [Treponema sp.]|nr:4Fe-4S binding protein [Treponema sp.]
MKHRIIKINGDMCNGCGLCVDACHEGAIGLRDGKAVLLREDYCDGLGSCLPVCPAGAISFEEKETAADPAVRPVPEVRKEERADGRPRGCPGSMAKSLQRTVSPAGKGAENGAAEAGVQTASRLNQWPVQIKLAPVNAPYFDGADLLISADCCAYAYGNFHNEFMKNRITLIGCPKLDGIDYGEKLSAILTSNNIRSVTVTRMEVPCCGGIEQAAVNALENRGKIPRQVVTITTGGERVEQ